MKKNLLTLTAIVGLFVANAAFAEEGHSHSDHNHGHKEKMMHGMKNMGHDCMGEHDGHVDDSCEDHMNHEKEHKGHDHKKKHDHKHNDHEDE